MCYVIHLEASLPPQSSPFFEKKFQVLTWYEFANWYFDIKLLYYKKMTFISHFTQKYQIPNKLICRVLSHFKINRPNGNFLSSFLRLCHSIQFVHQRGKDKSTAPN